MLRMLVIGVFLLLEPFAAFGQDVPWLGVDWTPEQSYDAERNRILRHVSYKPLAPKPLDGLPFQGDVRNFFWEDDEDLGFPDDTLSEQQFLRRMARIYRYQAELMDAQAREDHEAIEELLDRSMKALAILVDQPAAIERQQFRELYRTIVVENERYYGFSDSLMIEQGDIYVARDEAFRSMEEADRAPLDGISLPELEIADTEFPMTMNERVKSSIVFLLKEPDKHINNWLGRAETYFPMIEKIFAEEGVPDELKYLAMIESGLNPKARSWARAVGMWQFIQATGRAYDLNTNGWVDERMNPEKATRAAARHLKDLHRMFGDWQLALAGYNYSPGKLRRHLRRAKARLGRDAGYWDVYNRLPRETRNYVPMFIATALVASNPTAFGLGEGVVAGPAYEFDYVPVQGTLSLKEVAEMAGSDVETIKALNPELRSNHLPPTRSAYYVRIPIESYERFAERYRELPAAKTRPATHHRVRRGETLGQIARRYGVSVSSLMRKNGLHSSVIRIGQNLIVPVTNYVGGIELTDARPVRVRYGMRYLRPIAPPSTMSLDSSLLIARAEELRAEAETPVKTVNDSDSKQAGKAEAEKAASSSRVVYRVRRGDTLGKIAGQFRVSVSEIREWNNMKNTLIRIGQRLVLYPKP